MIAFISLLLFVYTGGFIMGAVIGLPQFKRKAKPVKPTKIAQYGNVIHVSEWRWLEQPTVNRRKQ